MAFFASLHRVGLATRDIRLHRMTVRCAKTSTLGALPNNERSSSSVFALFKFSSVSLALASTNILHAAPETTGAALSKLAINTSAC